MRTFSAAIVIMAFVSVALFGFTGLHMAEGHGGCAAAAMQTAECPFTYSSLKSIAFHVSALWDFSSALLYATVLLLLLSLVLLSSSRFATSLSPPRVLSPVHKRLKWRTYSKLVRWLSLFEHSPSLAL